MGGTPNKKKEFKPLSSIKEHPPKLRGETQQKKKNLKSGPKKKRGGKKNPRLGKRWEIHPGA